MIGATALALGFARAAAFAAAMPLGRARSVPPVARVAVALVLAPLFAERIVDEAAAGDIAGLARAALLNAINGAAVGLCATIIAGAAAAAGELFVTAIASQAIPARDVFGESGPVAALGAALFGWFFMSAGAFDRLAAICAAGVQGPPDVRTVVLLGTAFVQIALAAGAPAVLAQAFATILAALIARVAPRINSLFLGTPITSLLTFCILVVGGGAFTAAMAAIAWRAAAAPALSHL